MTGSFPSQDWLKQFSDPYAVLGVSVAADDRRILKRYRQVAKQLHPDVQALQGRAENEFIHLLLTRLVNPAYQRLKQERGRAEALATLRFRVRRLSRDERLQAKHPKAKALLTIAEAEVDTFYEQALDQLAANQYSSQAVFETTTRQIAELNLIYLRRKMGEPVIREKRTGLVSATEVNSVSLTNAEATAEQSTVNYADRHVQRARAYLKSQNYVAAIQELRDAVRIESNNSDYHVLLGRAYLMNNLPGMAKVHFRQALRLDPRHSLALKYAQQLKLDLRDLPGQSSSQPKKRGGGFFGLFARRR
ncbi:Chaperone protein DnaJ [Halomicronema hongdechloris C2206]|uniref:Chaperone protein DnaJ n=1 Tax=Halomicronema hongdechloris C2206 TaxID=1641165 RepID=A0A1Z3HHL9_9CYAN|nr:DnaJ domain-containing protein [Halomicronema hongdechloris]ASC69812.1 Chaperone protein DnaJ [Halomicronema hongdechloris C2206]